MGRGEKSKGVAAKKSCDWLPMRVAEYKTAWRLQQQQFPSPPTRYTMKIVSGNNAICRDRVGRNFGVTQISCTAVRGTVSKMWCLEKPQQAVFLRPELVCGCSWSFKRKITALRKLLRETRRLQSWWWTVVSKWRRTRPLSSLIHWGLILLQLHFSTLMDGRASSCAWDYVF